MAAILVIPALLMRSSAPIHNCRSGFTGFLIITGTSTPRNESAISCTVNGLAVERAPIHNTSTPCLRACSTWAAVATSTAVGKPVSFFAEFNQSRPIAPIPSNSPGRVRGFQIPALSILTLPLAAMATHESISCLSVSALQGPEITSGCDFVFTQLLRGAISSSSFMALYLIFRLVCKLLVRKSLMFINTHHCQVRSVFEYLW